MTIALAVLAYLILRAEQVRLFEPRGRELAAQFAGTAPPNGPLGRLVVNLELTSEQIRQLVASNRANLDATVDNMRQVSVALAQQLPQLSQNLSGLVAEVRALVADNRGSLH